MSTVTAASINGLEAAPWGVALTRDELNATTGGAIPIVALLVGAFIVSVGIGMLDRILFGGCTCR